MQGNTPERLPHIRTALTSPTTRKKKGSGFPAQSPTKRRATAGFLPSLTYPGHAGTRVFFTTVLPPADGQIEDLTPCPPTSEKGEHRVRIRGGPSAKDKLKKGLKSPTAVPSGYARLHSRPFSRDSPNFKQYQDKRLQMLRAAIEVTDLREEFDGVRLSERPRTVGDARSQVVQLHEDERRQRKQVMASQHEIRSTLFRMYIDLDGKAPTFETARDQLLELEAAGRQALMCDHRLAVGTTVERLTTRGTAFLVTEEKNARRQIILSEADKRSMKFSEWLGLSEINRATPPPGSLRTAESIEYKEECKRGELVATEEYTRIQIGERELYFRGNVARSSSPSGSSPYDAEVQFTCKKNVLMESEENRRETVRSKETEGRSELLHMWLVESELFLSVNGKYATPAKNPLDDSVELSSVDIGVGDTFTARNLRAQLDSTLTEKSAFGVVLATVLLSQESGRMEVMALEKRERGLIKINATPQKVKVDSSLSQALREQRHQRDEAGAPTKSPRTLR
eukprot:NODE_1600_length_1668_cov_59.677670_g1521_i0.p1 GENE.NODE_1600_length_1668_cov_59.677670_g1521_i0~~NODE_1600_length_1668_cov_59.677670_g1521_i0.p1  ORF type:complete len:511 (+),score=114.95 NODE_1600_length_1668_cov_59.677670_g1521_i0:132-1664(+)